jgi:hypothetical protein
VTEVRSLDCYLQIEEHQAGSQEDPGFYGKVWDQVHAHFPAAILSYEVCFQLWSLLFVELELLSYLSPPVSPACCLYGLRKEVVANVQPIGKLPVYHA